MTAWLSGRMPVLVLASASPRRLELLRQIGIVSQVAFKRLSDEELAAYLNSDEWHGKAGGYAIQGRAAAFVPWISGSYSNVVGLPLYETAQLLAGRGYRLPWQASC